MSASSLLNSNVINPATGSIGQLDAGLVKGADILTGVATLVAGTVNITPGFVLNATQTIIALPNTSATNANGGAYTCALVAPVPPAKQNTVFSITSSNGADVGTVRWFVFT